MKKRVIVLGCGEVGGPLANILESTYLVYRLDSAREDYHDLYEKLREEKDCEALHVCIPGGMKRFKAEVQIAIVHFLPKMVFIHSTTPPGTTIQIREMTSIPICHAQVHGKHKNMQADMLRLPKVLGGATPEMVEHLKAAGLNDIIILDSPTESELSKLLATTAYGHLIAFYQVAERIAKKYGTDYTQIMKVVESLANNHDHPDFKWNKFPGFVGGHCVMPNIEILQQSEPEESNFWEFLQESNERTPKEKL